MQSEKVIVSKEVAEAIEKARRIHGGAGLVARMVNNNGMVVYPGILNTIREYVNDEGIDILMKALVIGYEVEKSPEEKLREYYEENKPLLHFDPNSVFFKKYGRREGVRKAIDILGISVEGINSAEANE